MSMKKVTALLLAGVLTFGLVACAGNGSTTGVPNGGVVPTNPNGNNNNQNNNNPAADRYVNADGESTNETLEQYDADSAKLYAKVFGEFQTAYEAATEAKTVSERYALMAVAEAKLLEAAPFLPIYTAGGNYAISRVVPYTISSVLWGNDSDRYDGLLVCTEFITNEHRNELKALYKQYKGTGEYVEKAKAYLKEKGYELQNSYGMNYNSDPQTWDFATTSRSADSEAIVLTLAGLMQYDNENVQQYALAESHSVSEDGLTYTFKIRKGVKWVDSQGKEIAELTAHDFVSGMHHILDNPEQTETLIRNIIKGAADYVTGKDTDFSKVGVKATDDYTLQYTLEAPCSYFMSMLGYNPFYPLCTSYFASKGGAYGEDWDASKCTYGQTANDIAYCGAYLVASHTEENSIKFVKNKAYWNAKNTTLETFTWNYYDGKELLKPYNDAVAGTIGGAGLNASAVEQAKKDGRFDTYCYTSSTIGTTYSMMWNINRGAYNNFNDASKLVSGHTEATAAATRAALQNQDFRLALSMAMDRGTYNAQSVGEALKLVRLRNSYTPGTFVTLEEDVTIKINGVEKTYAKGTNYGQIVQDQVSADGYEMKVYDPDADGGLGSSDGYDGWYNPEAAVKHLNKAIEALKAQGIEVTKENPIVLDFPVNNSSKTNQNMAQAAKQSIEAALNGLVKINLQDCSMEDWYYSAYYTDNGWENNYDMSNASGWGPDYGDPSTFLDTYLDSYDGYCTKNHGIY